MPLEAVMSKTPTGTYPNYISAMLDRLEGHVTQDDLAKVCSITQPTINALIQGRTRLTVERAQLIAPLLRCNWWELSATLEKIHSGAQENGYKKSILKSSATTRMLPVSFGPDTVPVLGHANGSDEAIILDPDNPIGEAPRHPNQQGVEGAYNVEIVGESMAPRYRPKEQACVNPKKNVFRGDDCVIQLIDGEAFVKEFVKKTAKEVICKQLNPEKEWRRPREKVKAIHAIVGRM